MNDQSTPNEEASRKELHIAFLLTGLTILLLVVTAPQISLTWDEPTYIVAAETYPGWFGELFTQPRLAVSEEGIAKYWAFSHEHPPLSNLWSGFIWLGARYLLDDLTA